MQNASDTAVYMAKSANGATVQIGNMTKMSRASTAALKGLAKIGNTLVNMGLAFVASKAISFVFDMITANANLLNSAKEVTSEFKDIESSINDYKQKISELHNVINDSSSSIADTTKARESLMSIQDELIAKFGTEKDTIKIITEAINNQAEALDNLNQKQYQQWKNGFNNKAFAQSTNDFISSSNIGNALYKLTEFDFLGAFDMLTQPTKSNIDTMIDSMQYAYYELEKTGDNTLDSLIEKTYGLSSTFDGSKFILSGNLNDVYDNLLEIQGISSDFNISNRFESEITRISNAASKTLTAYKEAYDTYILYEKILDDSKDNQYDEQFDLINRAKESYDKASLTGDKTKVKEAAENYSKILTNAVNLAMENSDKDIAHYFENMYPSLQQIAGEWRFNFEFNPNVNNLKYNISNALADLNGFSSEDILDFNSNIATQEQIDAYGTLNNVAFQYGLTLEQLITLLEKQKLVSSDSYQALADQFGESKINSLSYDDLQIAYIVSDGTIKSWEELNAQIEEYKVNQELSASPFSLSNTSAHLSKIQNQYKILTNAQKELENGSDGTLSASTYQEIVDSGLAEYLEVTNGQLSINSDNLLQQGEAAKAAAIASLQEAMCNDIMNLSLGNTEGLSDTAKAAIEGLGNNAAAAGNQAITAAGQFAGFAVAAQATIDGAKGKLGAESNAGAEFEAKAKAIVSSYTGLASQISNISFGGAGSSGASAGQDAADAYLEAFENELSELDTLKDRGKITEKQYLDALRKLYVKYYNDKEKYLDQYEKYEYQYLSGMKSLYESAFSYIVKQIDKRIDALRKESESQVANLEAQKKAAEEFYQSQIDDIDDQIESIDREIAAKQDLIDAINDAAEARKREIDLQKAQYDLERMQNQKINYVYKDGQMIYEADSTGIRDARENVEDAKREIEIAAVEKVIEGLEKQRDILEEQKEALEQALEASNAYWDAQIEQTEQYFDTLITGMEEYKSRWEELSEIEENAKMSLALEELGITEQDILGMSTEAFNNVKQAYMNILADMYNGNDQLLMQLSALSGIQLSDLTGYLDGTVDALDRLNQMDLEETNKSISGISGSFDSIAASAGSAASAIDGGSGGGDVQDNASGENNTPGNGGGGSGKSILNSIQTLSTEGVDNINKVANAFAGSNEDEQSGVSVASAVQQVIDKVGSGQAKSKNPNGNDTKAPTGKSSNSLMSAIQDQTEAALDIESGIPAQEKAWENLNEPLDKANELILSIKNSLEGMDGKEFSVTLSVHGPGIIGTIIQGIKGDADVEGTALLQGDWGAKNSRKSLVGELGQELIVRGSRFFTVGNNGAEMFNVQKGDIIFNHEQTELLLKHGRISSRGTSYADGTTNTFPDHLTPIDQLSDEYSIFRQFNEYLKKSTDIFSSAGSLHCPLEEIADSVSMIEHTVNNKNMNAMRTFEINIGDINLEGVQDVNSLSAAIVTRLPNLVIQELHRS